MHDLAIIVISTNEAHWLPACLTTILAQQGDCSLDLIVVDNGSTDGTSSWSKSGFRSREWSGRRTEDSLTPTTRLS